MRTVITFIAFLLLQGVASAQSLEGDKLLTLIGKPVSDPMFQDLKKQETFYTDAWDEDFADPNAAPGPKIHAISLIGPVSMLYTQGVGGGGKGSENRESEGAKRAGS